MLRQYNAQRGYPSPRGGLIGTTYAGDYVRLPRARFGRHNLARVLGWMNREYTAHHKDANGHWQNVWIRGGHMAQVQLVHNGLTLCVAEQYVREDD